MRAALTEGRLYDALLVTRQVLHTYNEASPYVGLAQWNGRRCDDCDEVTDPDALSGCPGCGDALCQDCEHSCADCESTYCRRCLRDDGPDLVCSACLAEREQRAEEDDELEDEPLPQHPEETYVPTTP